MAALDTLVNPPFANDPPVKLNLDAKVVGLVVAILAAIGGVLSLFGLLGLLGLGAAVTAFGGIFALALIGVIVNIVADVMMMIGGWQMYQGNESGKRLVIYGLAIAFLAQIILALGYTASSAILQLILLGIIYYVVVVSRFPGQTPNTSSSRGV
jgi:hypothetical protein